MPREAHLGHIPRKRFGQNFLTDQSVIDRILATIHPRATDEIIEIGPGQGALTRQLAASGARLTLVELDRDLVQTLQAEYGQLPQVKVVSADALKTDFSRLSQGGKLRIVGNLPYNISTPLLFHLTHHLAQIADMHFMLQKEVVERITAEPGSSDWGRLSIMLQLRCHTENLLEVPAEAFFPTPKVQSAVVRLTPKAEQPSTEQLQALETIVRTAFNNRRKTLRNSLKGLFGEAQLEALGIDPQVRPETLHLTAFQRLAAASLHAPSTSS